MHYLILNLSVAFLTGISSPNGFTLPVHNVISDDLVYVEFTNRSTFDDLVRAKADLAVKGITVDFLWIEFDKGKTYTIDGIKYNNLKSLSFTVDCHDGYSGSGMSALMLNRDKLSILRDYREKAKVAFGINVSPAE